MGTRIAIPGILLSTQDFLPAECMVYPQRWLDKVYLDFSRVYGNSDSYISLSDTEIFFGRVISQCRPYLRLYRVNQ
jgi:hypothetical protein